MMQEPKYDFQNGRVINRVSGEMIPKDEPVFVFRGRDIYAAAALAGYLREIIPNSQHAIAVEERLCQFETFARDHPERMTIPDTDISAGGHFE